MLLLNPWSLSSAFIQGIFRIKIVIHRVSKRKLKAKEAIKNYDFYSLPFISVIPTKFRTLLAQKVYIEYLIDIILILIKIYYCLHFTGENIEV